MSVKQETGKQEKDHRNQSWFIETVNDVINLRHNDQGGKKNKQIQQKKIQHQE